MENTTQEQEDLVDNTFSQTIDYIEDLVAPVDPSEGNTNHFDTVNTPEADQWELRWGTVGHPDIRET